MLHPTVSTSFVALGAEWELINFSEMPDQVFVRMIKPGGLIEAFDGKIRPVKFKPNHGKPFPCFYVMTVDARKSRTVCIPIKEWREHNGHSRT